MPTTVPNPLSLTDTLKAEAMRLGFASVGICPAVSPRGISRFDQWLAEGYAGEMSYLADRREAYQHPRHVLDGVRSVVMLTLNYRTAEPEPARPGHGRVARYAWGADYHDVVRGRLNVLADWLRARQPGAAVRGVVDTAPILEREYAQLAGLGWIGKNTLLLNRNQGSLFFLAALLTDLELQYDAPHETDHCGSCTACLDACPTNAFVAPYVLDSRKCISYLTIELKGPIPRELRAGIGDWVFGCDICQDVCPWNHRAPVSDDEALRPRIPDGQLELAALFDLDDDAFRHRFRYSPLWRARRRGLLRDAALAMGNHPDAGNLPALTQGLNDREPLIRGASAWALGECLQASVPAARDPLMARSGVEKDTYVMGEIRSALANTLCQA